MSKVKYLLLIIFIFLLASSIKGQSTTVSRTGIGTRNPKGALHVDGGKDNDKAETSGISAEQASTNDFIITDNGGIGVGNDAPNSNVKVDIRSIIPYDFSKSNNNVNNAIGIGTTAMTASVAGEGAIRFNPNIDGGVMEYSDGVQWVQLYKPVEKVNIVAQIRTATSLAKEKEVPIPNWTVLQSSGSGSQYFQESTGIFTAPRKGVYSFIITLNMISGNIALNSPYVQVDFRTPNGPSKRKALKTFGKAKVDAQAGFVQMFSTIELEAGEQIQPYIYHTVPKDASSRALRVSADPTSSDGAFNNLMIIEY